MKKILSILSIALLAFSYSCSSEEEPTITGDQQYTSVSSKLSGKVYSANGTRTIGGALVFSFDNNNKLIYTSSDHNGNFVLSLPEGQRKVYIQTGNGSNFRTEFSVNMKKGKDITADAASTKLNQIAKLAYVDGNYDEIEAIVTSLGYVITEISYNDLKNINVVDDYDVIFLNCGSRVGVNNPNQDTMVYDNLSTFVSNGGSLYASDWDIAYLIGGNSNSNACGTPGGFIDDSLLCAVNNGSSGLLNNCTISDPVLSTALGFNTVNIDFDMGSWEKIQNYSNTFWQVMVEHNSEALMLRTNQYFNPNAPVITVGNTNNNGYVTICHTTAGGNVTITIPQADWAAHQAHGDTMGSCTGNASSGYIFYTSFHNHAQGNIGNVAPILQYVILNM